MNPISPGNAERSFSSELESTAGKKEVWGTVWPAATATLPLTQVADKNHTVILLCVLYCE